MNWTKHVAKCGCKYGFEPDGEGMLTIDDWCSKFNGDLSGKKRLKFLRLNNYKMVGGSNALKLPEGVKEIEIYCREDMLLNGFKMPKSLKRMWIELYRTYEPDHVYDKKKYFKPQMDRLIAECLALDDGDDDYDDAEEAEFVEINKEMYKRRI